MANTKRKFGWFGQVYGKPIPAIWDADMPTPPHLLGDKVVELDQQDKRTLDDLIEEYPCPQLE